MLLLVAGVGMGAGQSVTVPTGDVSSVFVDALVSGEGVSFMWVFGAVVIGVAALAGAGAAVLVEVFK